MKPAFTVLIDGVNMTSPIADRLLSLTVRDECGGKADSVEIKLDDRDNRIAEPRDGAQIVVAMGYSGFPQMPMGVFTLQGLTYGIAPDTMTISGKAAELGGSLKDQKTREWSEITLDDIVTTIAGEHGLDPRVADRFKEVYFEHLAQKSESDINFLTRIAKDLDATATVKESALLFIGRGEGKSASGLVLPQTWIYKSKTLPGSQVTKNKLATFKSVVAWWHNEETGDKEKVTVGEGSPVHEITKPHGSEDEAQRAAQAKLDEEARKQHTARFVLPGNPLYRAEGQLLAIGYRPGIPFVWSTVSAAHKIDSNYTTTMAGELPKSDGSG